MGLPQDRTGLGASSVGPDICHGMIAVDSDEISPIATSGLGRRQTNDLWQEQLRPIFQAKLSGALGQSLALGILLVQHRPSRAEQPQRPIAMAAGAKNLAAGRIGAVGRVGEDAAAHAAGMEIADEARGSRMTHAGAERPAAVVGRIEDGHDKGVRAASRREQQRFVGKVRQVRHASRMELGESGEERSLGFAAVLDIAIIVVVAVIVIPWR